MKVMTLKLPDQLDRRLRVTAKQKRTTKSALARQALEAFLVDSRGQQTPSVHDLLADLAGSVEGPEDLATNPKYMEGFGR